MTVITAGCVTTLIRAIRTGISSVMYVITAGKGQIQNRKTMIMIAHLVRPIAMTLIAEMHVTTVQRSIIHIRKTGMVISLGMHATTRKI